jgi:hypothetical protein
VAAELHDAIVTLTVREFVDREVTHAQQLNQLRFDLSSKALELNHVETLRRLDELNHAHAQSTADKQSFLPRERFEQFTADNDNKWSAINKVISESAGANRMLILIMGVIFSVMTLVIRFWK